MWISNPPFGACDMLYYCDMQDLKTPPNNVEAERAVLGSIMLDTTGRSGDRVMDLCLTSGISPETFYDPRNRAIYAAMLAMNAFSSSSNEALLSISACCCISTWLFWA